MKPRLIQSTAIMLLVVVTASTGACTVVNAKTDTKSDAGSTAGSASGSASGSTSGSTSGASSGSLSGSASGSRSDSHRTNDASEKAVFVEKDCFFPFLQARTARFSKEQEARCSGTHYLPGSISLPTGD